MIYIPTLIFIIAGIVIPAKDVIPDLIRDLRLYCGIEKKNRDVSLYIPTLVVITT
jgi:hypothetical protein